MIRGHPMVSVGRLSRGLAVPVVYALSNALVDAFNAFDQRVVIEAARAASV